MNWILEAPDPQWKILPLTHITKGVFAEDIIRQKAVQATICPVFGELLAYFFYGRPAYRVGDDKVVKAEALCPYCFIFSPELLDRSKHIFAFDTGAFGARMYSQIISEEMEINDFRLDGKSSPNRLISKVFGSQKSYIVGKTNEISAEARPYEFHAKAYLDLITSPGRNEPDDRVFTIEVLFGNNVDLQDVLLAVVVPHTLWSENNEAPWLKELQNEKVEILTYEFAPGRNPEHYHTIMEMAVRQFYEDRNLIG